MAAMTRRTVLFAKILIVALAVGAPLLLFQSYRNSRDLLQRERELRASVTAERQQAARQIARGFIADAVAAGEGQGPRRGSPRAAIQGLPPFMDEAEFAELTGVRLAEQTVIDPRVIALLWADDRFYSGMPKRYAGMVECLLAAEPRLGREDFDRLLATAAEFWRGVGLDDGDYAFLLHKLPASLGERFAAQRALMALDPPPDGSGFHAVALAGQRRVLLTLGEAKLAELNRLMEAFELDVAFAPAPSWRDWGDLAISVDPLAAPSTRPARQSALLHAGAGVTVELILLLIYGALAKYEKAHRAQKQLLAAASHELRTPLAVIRQFAEMLVDRRDRVPEKMQTYHDHILRECLKMQVQVENLLGAAKFEHLAPRPEPAALELKPWLEGLIADAAALTEGRAAELDCPDGVEVRWDAAMMGQAVTNLLENARLHARTDAVVQARLEGGTAVVSVRDFGTEVDPKALARIRAFNPGRASKSGLGLGLYLVDRIVRAHGGALSFERASPGLRVALRMPRAAPSSA